MSETANCPDCDEKVTLKPGKSTVTCPACGGRFAVDGPSARGERREDREEKAERKKPKRKYREEWDDDDEGDAPERPARRGSLTWLWVLLSVGLLVLACCGGGGWWFVSTMRKARDDFDRKFEQARQEQQPVNNPQGRPKAPAQPDARTYPKRKPFDADPALVGGTSPVYLADLQPFDVSQGAWKFGRNGAMGADDGRWVVVNKVYYDHALAMHPPEGGGAARASFALGGQARRLKGKVALNDDWHDGEAWGTPSFAIYKDGKRVWSTTLKRRKTTIDFDIDVSGARVILLETTAEGSAHDAHCVWLDPVLEK